MTCNSHHIHPTSGAPEGFPEIHLVHRGAGDKSAESFYETRTSSVAWHSDVSYEQQPPGTTFLYVLDRPETGGDTLFVDAAEAYRRLSPLFQERLHGLKANHSAVEQANNSLGRGGIKRREPVINEHPIIRTHPATGEKAIYVNPQCMFFLCPLSLPVSPLRTGSKKCLSHPQHCRPETRRVRRAAQVPVRPPGLRRRLPGTRQVGGAHRRGLGQPGHAALGYPRLV